MLLGHAVESADERTAEALGIEPGAKVVRLETLARGGRTAGVAGDQLFRRKKVRVA